MPRIFTKEFKRGQTITMSVTDNGAESGNENTVTSKIKILPEGRNEVAADTAVAGTLTIAYRAATSSVDKGWDVTLSAADSEGLDLARYQIDVAVTQSGIVIVSESAIIEIVEPSSI